MQTSPQPPSPLPYSKAVCLVTGIPGAGKSFFCREAQKLLMETAFKDFPSMVGLFLEVDQVERLWLQNPEVFEGFEARLMG